MQDESDSGRLMLVLPLVLHQENGRWFIERQAANGLRLWLSHFPQITLLGPLSDEPVPATSRPIDEVPGAERLEVVGLPVAYSPGSFVREASRVRKLLAEHIDRSRYLHFAIGGLFGDWGAFAGLVASRRGRPFAVWTDRVESNVVAFQARSKQGLRRIYATGVSFLMRHYERSVIRRSSLGLFHGLDCHVAYARYSRAPHLVHDIHLARDARISDAQLEEKRARSAGAVPRILYAGRAHRDKGVYDWIDVLTIGAGAGIAFTAQWLGDGPELEAARREVETRGLSDRISFPGATSDHAALLSLLREQDLFLFCHKTKESPRCLIEALVSGTPIVGYETDYSRDLIAGHGGGLLTPQHDVAALANSLSDLLADRARLADLAGRAAADGRPFFDEAVFEHRSELMKTLPLRTNAG